MAFLKRRLFSTSVLRQVNRSHYDSLKPSLAYPSPNSRGALLDTPELQQLANKAKGSWKEFTQEETVKCKSQKRRG